MTDNVEVRLMQAADLPAVLEIQAACYTEVTPESKTSLAAKLAASPSTCFIASFEGARVGYLISLPWEFSNPPLLNAKTCHLPASPDCLYLHDLAVAPTVRRVGAGRALVEAFLDQLAVSSFKRASLIAVQNSAPYWERFGFRAVAPAEALQAKLASYGLDVKYMERPA